MRGELEERDIAIANLNSEIKGLRGENKTLVADLLECRPNLRAREVEVEDQVLTIAELKTQLSGVITELEARDNAIANLKTELEARGDKQLNLFPGQEPTPIPTPEPTPELTPEPTPQPEPNPEPTDTTGTLTRGELVKYIHYNFPGATITGQNIGDCYSFDKKGRLKSSRMPEFEGTYGFKYLGKIDGVTRFQPIPKL